MSNAIKDEWATEDLALHRAEWQRFKDTGAATSQSMTACMNLADAYLAEHPADDEEEPDAAWLESIGFTYSQAGYWYSSDSPESSVGVWLKSRRLMVNGSTLDRPTFTRRSVRALLHALGVSP